MKLRRGPWWSATVGGSSGITALALQDHQAAWVILAAFSAWLAHNVIMTVPGSRTIPRAIVGSGETR